MEDYYIPSNIDELFKTVLEEDGYVQYRIIDYGDGMSMDNIESLSYFLEIIEISYQNIEVDYDTQVTLRHPDYEKRIIIDSGGLGDFFSHEFICQWEEQ